MNEIVLRPIQQQDNAEIAGIIRKTLEEFGANKPGTVYFDPATDDMFRAFRMRFMDDKRYKGRLLRTAEIFLLSAKPSCQMTARI
jgi:putative acetyltransferase